LSREKHFSRLPTSAEGERETVLAQRLYYEPIFLVLEDDGLGWYQDSDISLD